MFGLFQWISIFLLVTNRVFAREMTSYLSVNAQRYRQRVLDESISSIEELLSLSNSEEPIILLQFSDFNIIEEMSKSSGTKYPFLWSLFKNDLTGILPEDEEAKELANTNYLEVSVLPAPANEYLIGKFSKDDDAVIIQFTEKEYDMEELDEFLSLLYVFMEDSLSNVDNMALQIPSSDSSFKVQQMRDAASGSISVDYPETSKVPDSDNDELSSLWTEGLLSCLIVSFILLAILGIAISWISSLNISYGALEKSTNPLKKTN